MQTLQAGSLAPDVQIASTPVPVRQGSTIIATDGRSKSDSALYMGTLLAKSLDEIRVVSVLKPISVMPAEAPLLASAEIEATRRQALRRDLDSQMTRTWAYLREVEVFDGDPASTIAQLAHRDNASLIVTGLGRHLVSDRLFGDETALRLMRLCDVPVFAAAAALKHVPRRVLIAVDFSDSSLLAAQLAIDLADPDGTVFLAHVAPRESLLNQWSGAYKADASKALAEFRHKLRVPPQTAIQDVQLSGDPATELLAFAASVDADLIAAGSHGYGFISRMLIGSVTSRLVRCSSCSVLVVPKAATNHHERLAVEPITERVLPESEWTFTLNEFSRRNAGRLGTLEVHDFLLGTQRQRVSFPFQGAVYEPHDRQVVLLFSEIGDMERHLTRDIRGVTTFEVLRDQSGVDRAIRLRHGNAVTTLSFM